MFYLNLTHLFLNYNSRKARFYFLNNSKYFYYNLKINVLCKNNIYLFINVFCAFFIII